MKKLQKILLVEDENDIRTVARLSLEKYGGFEIIEASNGVHALEILENEKPDLIVLDVMMPKMGGVETFGKLIENPQTSNIPVLFLTAKTQREEREHYLNLGVLGVISKPFDPLKLADEVQKYWLQYLDFAKAS